MIAHLLRGCTRCQQQMGPLASVMFTEAPPVSDAPATTGSEYDFPLFKAFASARRYAAEAALKKSSAQNDSKPYPQKLASKAAAPSLEHLDPKQRCETLLERCRALRYSDHEGMVLLASLAVTLAERLDALSGTPEEIADLQARAWSELGNAYRVSDDLPAAESALARATKRSRQGSGDPLLLARLMDLTASLYIDQRRFEEADRLLDCVYTIYSRQGDASAAARAIVSRGLSAGYAFQTEQAIQFLSEGIRQIDAQRDPKLLFAAAHNLLWCLVDADRIEEASNLLREVRGLYTANGERFDELKAHWLEGRIAAGSGDEEAAERAFLQVREGFKNADLFYDAALVSLYLATLWLSQGRTAEIRGLIDEMVATFRARNIQREALGALIVLQKALRRDQMTADLLQATLLDLWRMERLPAKSSRPSV